MADEGVVVVMSCCWFGWQGNHEGCPYGRGVLVADECTAAVMGCWWFGW